MRVVAVGRLRGEEAKLFARYAIMTRPSLTAVEIDDAKGAPPEARRREATAILGAIPAGALIVALDKGGLAEGSLDFARRLNGWLSEGSSPCFVIGGAEGLDERVLARARHVLSFGPMTWPHRLARVMLAEQIWRARAIMAGHPYHRA